MSKLQELQNRIGYTFEKEGLLRQALTHSSYANEKHMKKQMRSICTDFPIMRDWSF